MDKLEMYEITRALLFAIGEDPEREGLQDTPRRVADFWEEFIEYKPGTLDVTFESVQVDELVIARGLRVWSLCEHHLIPFWCDLSIGYLAKKRVLGLSKLARIAHERAHRLQLQERMVSEIAAAVAGYTGCEDVAVVGKGVHLCMVMRGIKTPGEYVTSAMLGKFRESYPLRAEFLKLAGL